MRKTIKVEDLKAQVNKMLQHSTCSAEVRRGMIAVLEDVLFITHNYDGYRYLPQFDVSATELPGVRYDESGNILPYEERFTNTDDTRRQYY